MGTLLAQVCLWSYLLYLVRRTGFLANPVSIDLGIIYGFLLASLICFLVPLLIIRVDSTWRRFLLGQAAGAALVGLAMLVLHGKGYVGEFWY